MRQVNYALYRLTEPVLGPIRRFMPDLGGIDISPIIVFLAMYFIRCLVLYYGAALDCDGQLPLTPEQRRPPRSSASRPNRPREAIAGLYTAPTARCRCSQSQGATRTRARPMRRLSKLLAKVAGPAQSRPSLITAGETDRSEDGQNRRRTHQQSSDASPPHSRDQTAMIAKIIDGKAYAAGLRVRIAKAVKELEAKHGLKPGLAVVLVGEDPASKVYVANKAKQTVEVGMNSWEHRLRCGDLGSGTSGLVDKLNTRSGRAWHPGAVAAAQADRFRPRS